MPVALGGQGVQSKVFKALQIANGRSFADDAEIEAFMNEELRFPVRSGFGGNSSCVEIEAGQGEYIICDMGSGLREMAQHLMARHGPDAPQTYNIFLSHPHWDHIMGLPFFTPAYIPGNRIRIHGCHATIDEALRKQQEDPCFPVHFDFFGADIEILTLEPGETYDIAGASVRGIKQPHHGDSYGYRFEQNGKAVVYSTDGEHKLEDQAETDRFIEFYREADLLIFDAMYTLAEMISVKEDWGHSSNIIGVDLCHRAGVKHYCMFHHEPIFDDEMLQKVLEETRRYEEIMREDHQLEISTAYDGLEIQV